MNHQGDAYGHPPRLGTHEDSDWALIRRIGDGDPKAFERLYKRYYHYLFRFVHRITGIFVLSCSMMTRKEVRVQGRLKELEDRLATDSRNSSKPPSNDGFVKQTRSLWESPTRKCGGQPGHRGAMLEQMAEPDQILLLQCTACGSVLSKVADPHGEERRQVFDLPPLKLHVTFPLVGAKECPAWGSQTSGTFLEEIPTEASYGAGVTRAYSPRFSKGHR